MDTSTGLSAGLNAGLTQALSDGTNAYIYGNGRIAQVNTTTEYFLGDALGSVRQLTNPSGSIAYAKVYDPYGVVTAAAGASQSAYGYTSEYTSQGLVYLRARMYAPGMGRFLTRDTWMGDYNRPLSFNRWMYVDGNPINKIDPTGLFSRTQVAQSFGFNNFSDVIGYYDTHGEHWGFLAALLRALPGDYLISEQFRIEPFTKPYKRAKAYYVGYDSNQGITLDGMPLQAIFMLNNSTNPTRGIAAVPWRPRSWDANFYTVTDVGMGKEEYIDSPSEIDIPDFWAVSVSLSVFQGMYMVDRFGHQYLTIGLSISTSDVGAAYVEGYVGLPTGIPFTLSTYLPEDILYNQLKEWGNCLSYEVALMIGNSGGVCFNQTFMMMYSAGIQITAGVGWAPYTWDLGQDSSMEWDSIIQDMRGGINREQLSNIWPNIYDGCNDNLPHLLPINLQ